MLDYVALFSLSITDCGRFYTLALFCGRFKPRDNFSGRFMHLNTFCGKFSELWQFYVARKICGIS